MNKIFKTKWSAAHQQYVVTDEHHATKGKAAKSVVAATVAAVAAMAAGMASAAYVDPGFKAFGLSSVEAAKSSWETAEYQKDWGLAAMHASTAYALGYTGEKVAVGVMDSGALINKHPDLTDGNRFTGTKIDEEYGSTGNRYPQYAGQFDDEAQTKPTDTRPYEPGQTNKEITGEWMEGVNDSHGTHVTGTVGGNRDGSEFHGVAFGSDIIVGNTGATDDNNYGPFQDYTYFKNAWGKLAEEVAAANGDRGGFINNSWGTNTRVEDQGDTGFDGYSTGVHLNVNTEAETDYEFMLFAKRYGVGGANATEGITDGFDTTVGDGIVDNKSFVYAAYEAVKDKKIVQIMTTGNRDMKNPYYRALYPLYNPAAEKHWIAVAGLKQGANAGEYELIKNFNEAGQGKWWTVAAPGNGIYSSTTGDHGEPGYASWGGTSMAAPHVAGAMGVLMSRYDQMDALQVRDVMLTTANHKNADGSNMEGWNNTDGSTPLDGQVSDRMGWGVPDLAKGMYGPGQFLGAFNYEMKDAGSRDVWSNDITSVALDQRAAEDKKWMEDTANGTKLPYDKIVNGSGFVVKDGDANKTDEERESHVVGGAEEDVLKAAYLERAHAIEERQKNDNEGYKGSLVKDGAGKLVMTGNNSYKGTTEVKGGTLLAFAESIGGKNEKGEATVKVTGGTFGVIGAYNDDLTMTGYKESAEAQAEKLTVTLENGATLYVAAGSDVKVKSATGVTAVKVGFEGASRQGLINAYQGDENTVAGTFSMKEGDFSNLTNDNIDVEDEIKSVFFESVSGQLNEKKTAIETKLIRNDKKFADFATTKNERAVAEALEASKAGVAGEILGMTNADEVKSTIAGFSDDMYAAARNAMVVNALAVTHAVADQARGFGEGRTAELENGNVRLWATGMGYWGDAEGSESSLDVDFRAGLIGAEVNVCPATKLGAFFGAGTTDYKGSFGKIDGDDTHFGVYGVTDYAGFSFTYGVSYMTEDRDSQHVLAGVGAKHSEDASVLQAHAEAAYRFDVAGALVDPYFGLSWARVDSDGFTERGMKTKDRTDDIQVASLGARVTMPFTMGSMPVAFKADAGWSHFFGDTEAVTELQMGAGGAYAELEGKELKDQFNVGLGLTAQVAKTATVGVSYTSSFGTDADTHGVMGTVKIAF